MAEEESEEKEYHRETGYEKTWEAIKEDDHGLLEASVADIIHNAKRKRQLERKQGPRLGVMRSLYHLGCLRVNVESRFKTDSVLVFPKAMRKTLMSR